MLLFIWMCFFIFLFLTFNQKEYNVEKFSMLSLVYFGFICLLAELSLRHNSGFIIFTSFISLITITIMIAVHISQN